jgi:SAM-dependent methyltransferase
MEFKDIDWNAMWKAESESARWSNTQKETWNKRADSFSQRINRASNGKEGLDKDDYISKMLDHIEVQPDWSVLDIGCGPGTLAIPLAKKARSVTALDFSSEMLRHLKKAADQNGLENIRCINSSWQDAFDGKILEEHDVIVASRSLMSGDMKNAISGIIPLTKRAAYLTFPIVHLPFDWEIYRAIGRTGKRHPPYIYFVNLLYQMGIEVNVEILRSRVKVQFSSIKETIDSVQWRTDPFTPEELSRLTRFLEKKFAEQKNLPVFTHKGFSKWALVWWKKENSV